MCARHGRRWSVLVCFLFALALVPAGCGGATAPPTMRIVSPAEGATVKGPAVKVDVAVTNWKLVEAGAAPVDGEGHLHFFIDTPASSIAAGQVIPPTDTNPAYVHAGKEPLTSRELQLNPGTHTITVVMGNASHIALDNPAPQSVTITVE